MQALTAVLVSCPLTGAWSAEGWISTTSISSVSGESLTFDFLLTSTLWISSISPGSGVEVRAGVSNLSLLLGCNVTPVASANPSLSLKSSSSSSLEVSSTSCTILSMVLSCHLKEVIPKSPAVFLLTANSSRILKISRSSLLSFLYSIVGSISTYLSTNLMPAGPQSCSRILGMPDSCSGWQ